MTCISLFYILFLFHTQLNGGVKAELNLHFMQSVRNFCISRVAKLLLFIPFVV